MFKRFDILFFSLLGALSNIMSYYFLGKLNSAFFFNFVTTIWLISSIRWGKNGIFIIFLSSIPMLFISEMEIVPSIIYNIVANLFFIIPILLYGKRDRNKIISKKFNFFLYILICHISLSIGKGLAILLIAKELTGIISYFSSSIFIIVIDILVCLILTRVKGLITDMEKYNDAEGD